jgi:ArsR family transcriptional regulator, arsenate/arsenite/antimonite-responsive transcriptional repressor
MKRHELFKILGDETRFDIVSYLADLRERSCAELSEKFPHLSQPTLSHHYKVLADADVIVVRKEGTSCRYTLKRETLDDAGVTLH